MYCLSRNLSSEPTVKRTACAKTTSKNVDVATSALSRDLLFLLSLRTPKLLYRRRGLSHTLSHRLSHRLVI
jgi:hypothetical protein